MERRQDRANHMMTRADDQINQAKVDNYKGGIFAPIQYVSNLSPGYGVIGTYPFSYDGIWVSADFESSEPAFTGPSPLTAQSRRCLAVHQYDRGEEWAGWTDSLTEQNLPFLSRPQGRSYPFKINWDTSASASGSKLVFKYDGGNMLYSYGYRIFQGMSFTYDWKRGQLLIQATISAYDEPEWSYAAYTNGSINAGTGWTGPQVKYRSFKVKEYITVTCNHWMDFDPDNPPFSGNAGSITVPGTMQQLKINISGLPTAVVEDPGVEHGTGGYPDYFLPDYLKGYPYSTWYPEGSNPNQYCSNPYSEGPESSASSICSSGPATFTFRWDKPTAECIHNPYNLIPPRIPDPDYPDDPTKTIPNPDYTLCVYKHWDEYDK